MLPFFPQLGIGKPSQDDFCFSFVTLKINSESSQLAGFVTAFFSETFF